MNTNIFKSYDIRGIYPNDLNEKDAYSIGHAIATYLKARNIAVGRDARPSSPALFENLCAGINDAGCNVLDLGLASTPLVYFASHESGIDGAISLTASHNPPEWNGFKVTKKDAVPVGGNSGLKEIKEMAMSEERVSAGIIHGVVIPMADLVERYVSHIGSFWQLGDKKFKLVIDTANAMGIVELPIYKKVAGNLTITNLYADMEKFGQTHEANPLKTETLDELRKKVIETGADVGIGYDGDADRVGFVDEKGEVVPMDLMTAILAAPILRKYPKSTILYDLRSSVSVKEAIETLGGTAHECMVGHANIKKQMRDEGSYFAGELSGHYYFKENSYAESSTLAAIFLLNEMARSGKKLSELVAEVRKYFHSGEINTSVVDTEGVIGRLKEKYKDGKLSELDGIKIDYPDPSDPLRTSWWFNVRVSNTEGVMRLNLEAKTKEMMEEKREELLKIIRGQ